MLKIIIARVKANVVNATEMLFHAIVAVADGFYTPNYLGRVSLKRDLHVYTFINYIT